MTTYTYEEIMAMKPVLEGRAIVVRKNGKRYIVKMTVEGQHILKEVNNK